MIAIPGNVRVIVPWPVASSCCGGSRLSSLGEHITETLEVKPVDFRKGAEGLATLVREAIVVR